MAEVEIKLNYELVLKPLNVEDAEEIAELIKSDKSLLAEWINDDLYGKTIEFTREFLIQEIKCCEIRKIFLFTLRENNSLVGITGFYNTDRFNNKTEIVLWFSDKIRTVQFYSEVIKELLAIGFNEKKFNRITIKAPANDYTFLSVLRKFGFIIEGTERLGHYMFNKYSDIVFLGLLNKEYREQIEFFHRAEKLFQRDKSKKK
ncbi:MAG: GNAT family protein [Bacteroidales bacterium]|nr:GNAT family protein [Bacteroidales bacterium]MDD3858888.1 GNAT family protein [Bacteroidales bacterium]